MNWDATLATFWLAMGLLTLAGLAFALPVALILCVLFS